MNVSGNHYKSWSCGVKVVLRTLSGSGVPSQSLVILCIKCFSINLIDNHFMHIFNIFADIVNIDFKINRLDANASYVEI